MACNSLVSVPLVAGLLLASGGAWAAENEALPGGSGDAFRQQMTAWSQPALETAPPVAATIPEEPKAQTLPRLSSRFGLRADPLTGRQRMHEGIDIPGPLGSQVIAAESGIVAFAGRAGGYGLMIELDHGNGLKTRYAHLSHASVRPGALVSRQQPIGQMGSSGRSTGSHLHFEVLRNGAEVDPLTLLGGNRPQYSVMRPDPFIGETGPVHISRFAQARAAKADSAPDQAGCHRPQGRVEVGCPD